MPVLSSRSGNLFADTRDAGLHWYLPALALAPDVDPAFVFAASQSGQQADGQPFNTATLSLRVLSTQPNDVVAFAAANPTARLRAIPLQGVNVTLSSSYKDGAGAVQRRTFAGAQQDQPDGSILLTFSTTILGDAVPALFQDLKLFGDAVLDLNATFETQATRWMVRPLPPAPRPHPGPPSPIGPDRRPPAPSALISVEPKPDPRVDPAVAVAAPARGAVLPAEPIVHRPIPIFPGTWVTYFAPQPWTQSLPLGLKYAISAYQLQYSIDLAGAPPAVLTSVAQLKSFNAAQSQFVELESMGDLSLTYPTIARAFVGSLSQEIVLIPQRYAIIRSESGVAATCYARVDPSSTQTGASMFEFVFTVAPDVSRLDVQAFQDAIQGHVAFKDYQVSFASALSSTPSTLTTSFANSALFSVGPAAHTFSITLPVRDAGSQAPAVADANLVIQRLYSDRGADLVGTLNLSIDPGMSGLISAALDLNFFNTVGTDDLVATIDSATSAIQVTNQSPLDVTIKACAILQNGVLTTLPAPVDIGAGATSTMAWPADLAPPSAPLFLADAQLKLSADVPASKLVSFVTIDVTSTQLFMAIDASQVDFTTVGSLSVVVVFPSVDQSQPTQFTLTNAAPVASAQINLPLQDAVFSLPASIAVTVSPIDPTAASFTFDLQNDFNSEPTLTLHQSDIDAAKSG
jgi:hypothetical protein